MNSGNDEQRWVVSVLTELGGIAQPYPLPAPSYRLPVSRWRSTNANQRGQGQRRGITRSGDSYAGQGYNQNNNSNGNSNVWGGGMNMSHHQQQQTNAGYYEQHVPVNGFNPQEALELLTRGYDFQLQAARAPPGPDGDRPIIYKGDKGWSTPKGSNNAWGQKRNSMASGADFLVQLKKSHAGVLQNAGREQQ
ncbi:hypothetical protein BDD12DRAFT_882137 [Trichophaea hybrida]|nr:hypothetical protein BDD12DRAFT_882137 [Trichophaea hybrida]